MITPTTSVGARRAQHAVAAALVVAALALVGLGVARTVTLPRDEFVSWVPIDDTLYYYVPARHLVEGKGFSFDGVHRTNGVQPLWALVTIAIAAAVPDRVEALRALCAASALAWMAAAAVLFLALRRFGPALAAVAAIGFACALVPAGALTGMENGLAALTVAIALWVALRYAGAERSPPSAFAALGVSAGLVALARVEMGLLLAILGALVLAGAFGRARLREVLAFGVPPAALLLAYLASNLAWFGAPLPVSGSAKQWYESRWLAAGYPTGSLPGSVAEQLGRVLRMALRSVSATGEHALYRAFGVLEAGPAIHAGALVVLAVGAGFAALRGIRALRGAGSEARVAAVGVGFAAFAGVHFLMMAALLPHFTEYGTWYFAPELLLAWALVAAGAAAVASPLRRRLPATATWALLAMAALLVIANRGATQGLPLPAQREKRIFVRAGEWLEARLPPGTRVGSWSAGWVGFTAASHAVFNLDGLVNTREFLEDFLKRDRLLDYVTRERIELLADYRAIPEWSRGFEGGGQVPLSRLELVRWWPFGRELAYGVFRVRERDAAADTLAPCGAGACDRPSRVQFAAAVEGRFPVVADDALATYVRAHPGARVVTSFPPMEGEAALRHVLMSPSEVRALALGEREIDLGRRIDARFGAVRLLGVDAPLWTVPRGGVFVLTRAWRADGAPAADDRAFVVQLRAGALERPWHEDRGCHGTCPLSTWSAGDVVTETYTLRVPEDLAPGVYEVRIGVVGRHGGAVLAAARADELVTVGELEVR